MKREMVSVIATLALSLFAVHCGDGLEALVNPGSRRASLERLGGGLQVRRL